MVQALGAVISGIGWVAKSWVLIHDTQGNY